MIKKIKLTMVMVVTIVTASCATLPKDKDPSIRDANQSATKQATKELGVEDGFKHMFEDGAVSGNIRSMYSGYNNDNDINTYATAIGGQLQYELAKYKGFNASFAFTTTQDINFASGDRDEGKRNDELSSAKGIYTQLTQAYINYESQDLNIRVGRQLIDTPLADSDDIRMDPNTFEGYIASYEINGFSFMAGHLSKWQGYDAGLDINDPWVKMGKDGVNFGGISFSNDYVKTNVWYYNISNASTSDIANGADANGNNAIYVDAIGSYIFNDDLEIHTGLQYLKESELDNSNIQANIYGVMGKVVVNNFTFNVAYNKSAKESGKHSFSGFGGGTLFTNMDTMILDEITEDRDAQAVVTGLAYTISDFNLFYTYGDFKGDADDIGAKAHITEQDIGAEYTANDNFTVSVIYVIDNNKEDVASTYFNDKNLRVLVSYNF